MKELNKLLDSINKLYEVEYSYKLSKKILNEYKNNSPFKKENNQELIDFKNILNDLNDLSYFISNEINKELDF